MTLYSRVRQHLATPLYANAYFLMINAFATSGLGFIFWLMVANRFSPESVGIASGYLSTIALISSLANLGLGFGAVYFLPKTPSEKLRARLINNIYTLTGMAALLLATFYLLLANHLTPALDFVNNNVGNVVFVLLFALAWTWYGVSDHIFLAYRQGRYVLWKNLIANLLKIPLPLFVFTTPLIGIQASIALSMGVAVAWIMAIAIPKLQPGYVLRSVLLSGQTQQLAAYALPNHISSWLWGSPNLILPIIVLNRFGPEANAAFFAAWMIASLVNVFGASVAGSLFAEGTQVPQALSYYLKRATALALGLQTVVVVGIWILGKYMLGLFGAHYSENAATVLNILLLASYGATLSPLAQTAFRIKNNMLILVSVTATPLIIILIADSLLSIRSIEALAWTWLAGVSASGAVGLTAAWHTSRAKRAQR